MATAATAAAGTASAATAERKLILFKAFPFRR
jgi:hypothetical protein